MSFNDQNPPCHPERSEGSLARADPSLRMTPHCRSWFLKFIIGAYTCNDDIAKFIYPGNPARWYHCRCRLFFNYMRPWQDHANGESLTAIELCGQGLPLKDDSPCACIVVLLLFCWPEPGGMALQFPESGNPQVHELNRGPRSRVAIVCLIGVVEASS